MAQQRQVTLLPRTRLSGYDDNSPRVRVGTTIRLQIESIESTSTGLSSHRSAFGLKAAAPSPAPAGQGPECEVWQLLGRADVIVRSVLEAQDRAERRLGEERARVWLRDVARAWLGTGHRSW